MIPCSKKYRNVKKLLKPRPNREEALNNKKGKGDKTVGAEVHSLSTSRPGDCDMALDPRQLAGCQKRGRNLDGSSQATDIIMHRTTGRFTKSANGSTAINEWNAVSAEADA
jgi:hypothetical protein